MLFQNKKVVIDAEVGEEVSASRAHPRDPLTSQSMRHQSSIVHLTR
jgi:hypothetical protein